MSSLPGLHIHASGETNVKAKLNDESVNVIRRAARLDDGFSNECWKLSHTNVWTFVHCSVGKSAQKKSKSNKSAI